MLRGRPQRGLVEPEDAHHVAGGAVVADVGHQHPALRCDGERLDVTHLGVEGVHADGRAGAGVDGEHPRRVAGVVDGPDRVGVADAQRQARRLGDPGVLEPEVDPAGPLRRPARDRRPPDGRSRRAAVSAASSRSRPPHGARPGAASGEVRRRRDRDLAVGPVLRQDALHRDPGLPTGCPNVKPVQRRQGRTARCRTGLPSVRSRLPRLPLKHLGLLGADEGAGRRAGDDDRATRVGDGHRGIALGGRRASATPRSSSGAQRQHAGVHSASVPR